MKKFDEAYEKVLSTPREIHVGSHVFTDVEVADDEASIEKGLMGREDVADDFCMLFKFPDERVRNFWMKDCLFPIIVVFLDRDLKIVAVHKMEVETTTDEKKMKRYSSIVPVKYAIEFKDSLKAALDIKMNDKARMFYNG